MRCRWREVLLSGAALSSAGPGAAQQARELGIEAVGTISDPAMVVAELYGALRTSTRTRGSLAFGAGVSSGELAWRGEGLAYFLLSPDERRRPGFYLGGGIAAVGGPVSRGYLVLTLGVEERPRADEGWALEAGIGGGFRVAVGYRWRRFPGLRP